MIKLVPPKNQTPSDVLEVNTSADLMSKDAFLDMGLDVVAYIKPILIDNEVAFGVHAANGEFLAMQDSKDAAMDLVQANNLAAVLVQ